MNVRGGGGVREHFLWGKHVQGMTKTDKSKAFIDKNLDAQPQFTHTCTCAHPPPFPPPRKQVLFSILSDQNKQTKSYSRWRNIGMGLREHLYWGKHIQATMTKVINTSAFIHKSPKGYPSTLNSCVYTHTHTHTHTHAY